MQVVLRNRMGWRDASSSRTRQCYNVLPVFFGDSQAKVAGMTFHIACLYVYWSFYSGTTQGLPRGTIYKPWVNGRPSRHGQVIWKPLIVRVLRWMVYRSSIATVDSTVCRTVLVTGKRGVRRS